MSCLKLSIVIIGMPKLRAFVILLDVPFTSLTTKCVVFLLTPEAMAPPCDIINASKAESRTPEKHTFMPAYLPFVSTCAFLGLMSGTLIDLTNW